MGKRGPIPKNQLPIAKPPRKDSKKFFSCSICNGIEGCDHTILERAEALFLK